MRLWGRGGGAGAEAARRAARSCVRGLLGVHCGGTGRHLHWYNNSCACRPRAIDDGGTRLACAGIEKCLFESTLCVLKLLGPSSYGGLSLGQCNVGGSPALEPALGHTSLADVPFHALLWICVRARRGVCGIVVKSGTALKENKP